MLIQEPFPLPPLSKFYTESGWIKKLEKDEDDKRQAQLGAIAAARAEEERQQREAEELAKQQEADKIRSQISMNGITAEQLALLTKQSRWW